MSTSAALIMMGGAGLINGSFALPTKYMKWKFENIWLQYVILAFIVFPWAFLAIFSPQAFSVYLQIPTTILLAMILGGIFFGIGQMCFAIAMSNIGLGLSFVINIGLGTALGSLLPFITQHANALNSPMGYVTLIAVAIIIVGLIFNYYAGKTRDQQQGVMHQGNFRLGIFLVIIAGLASAAQNVSFSLSSPLQDMALQAGMNTFTAANIFWPGFLTFSFIPYAFYMLALHQKNHSWSNYSMPGFLNHYALIIVMALCWYGSLLLYSKAAHLIGPIGPVIGWPLFMVLIILTSNFWGWKHNEWAGCSVKTKTYLLTGLSLLVLAMILLGYSASLTQ